MSDEPRKRLQLPIQENEEPGTLTGKFVSAAKSTGMFTAKAAVLAGTFMTGAALGLAFTNLNNNNEKDIIRDSTTSNPSMPITVSSDLQIILSDTSVTVISHGIPCAIALDEPSEMDITLGNTGEATVNEVTSILESLGLTAESHVVKKPADTAENILKQRYAAEAECRNDILRAAGIQNAETQKGGTNNSPKPQTPEF